MEISIVQKKMGQPKKLTFKQRLQIKEQQVLDEKLAPVLRDLRSIMKGLRGRGDVDFAMWRRASLDVFRRVSNPHEFPQTDLNVRRHMDSALQLACEAQGVMNFRA